MSLLSNLLSFSSLNASPQKQQRSSSASSRFLFEVEDPNKSNEIKERLVSKSLSKMGLISNSNQAKINPKYRCLHRIAHSLSMKVRKHYYALFVTLQTMKKNNTRVKKSSINNQDLQMALNKLSQVFSICYSKRFQSTYKAQVFEKINKFSKKAQIIQTLDKIYIKKSQNFYAHKLFRFFSELQKLEMKTDLLTSALNTIIKKQNQQQIRQSLDKIKESKVSKLKNHQQNQQQTQQQNQHFNVSANKQQKSISIFQIFDNMQQKASENQNHSAQITSHRSELTLSKQLNKVQHDEIKNATRILQQYDQGYKEQNLISKHNRERDRTSQYILETNHFGLKTQALHTPYQSRFQSLQSSPADRSSMKSKSPYQTSKKIPNLKQSVAKDTLQSKNYQKVYKSYHVSVDFNESPFTFQRKIESIPKMMNKITPQQLAHTEVQDLADKSNIFRDFRASKISSIDSLEISNVVCQPFMRAETIISDFQRNRQRYDNNSQRSQISYAPYLPHDNSISSINHKDQSNFGCDAVNFKNSLVLQRQSMKKTQKQKMDLFIKKKTVLSNNQMMDHHCHQLQNLKNKKNNKNQYSDRKPVLNKLPQYQQGYSLNTDYLVKRQTPVFQFNKTTKNPMMQTNLNLNDGCNWEQKKTNQYNTDPKNKSFSFNSSSQIISRRLKFNEIQKKSNDDGYNSSIYSNNGFRDPLSWKNDLLESRSEMPVRDVGLDPYSKIRVKNNSFSQSQSQSLQGQSNKQISSSNKKFISISKR